MPAKRTRQARENVTEIQPVRVEAANENPAQDGFAAADKEGQPELEQEAAADAAEQILGANPLLGIDREELLAAGRRLLRLMTVNPQVLIEENLAFARELIEIAFGRSKVLPDARDRRFSHNVWQKSGYYKRLMQGFVAWRDMLNRVLDRADTTTDDRERARFVLQLRQREDLAPHRPGGCDLVRVGADAERNGERGVAMHNHLHLRLVTAAQRDAEEIADANIDGHPHALDGTVQHDAFAMKLDFAHAAVCTGVLRLKGERKRKWVEPQGAARPGGVDPAC